MPFVAPLHPSSTARAHPHRFLFRPAIIGAVFNAYRQFASTAVILEQGKEKVETALPLPTPRPMQRFSPEEDKRLLELKKQGLGWQAIGAELGRPWYSCRDRAEYIAVEKSEKREWTASDDETIMQGKKEGKGVAEIGRMIKRDRRRVRARWQFLSPTYRTWNPRDDAALVATVQTALKLQCRPDWEVIAAQFHRSIFVVRRRYEDHLDPLLKRGRWSKEENQFLLKKVSEAVSAGWQPNWAAIARDLRRPGNNIQAHYNSITDGKKKDQFSSEELDLIIEMMRTAQSEKDGFKDLAGKLGRQQKSIRECYRRLQKKGLGAERK
ncbi:hypothetical protein HK104_007718 [Borealophlyctis nickersoniae]|nr:hypothetical protein HK104_007718 [Borealophlyctis nickersoniae]